MKILHIILACIAISISACSTSQSTMKSVGSGSKTIYEISEQQASEIAVSAIHSVFGDVEISEINGSVRGFSTFMLAWSTMDSFKHNVIIHPVAGLDSSGKKINGFNFEVSGKGSSFLHGGIKNQQLFKAVKQYADETKKGIVITNLEARPYELTKPQGPSAIAPTQTVEIRLTNLQSLREKGLIDESESLVSG